MSDPHRFAPIVHGGCRRMFVAFVLASFFTSVSGYAETPQRLLRILTSIDSAYLSNLTVHGECSDLQLRIGSPGVVVRLRFCLAMEKNTQGLRETAIQVPKIPPAIVKAVGEDTAYTIVKNLFLFDASGESAELYGTARFSYGGLDISKVPDERLAWVLLLCPPKNDDLKFQVLRLMWAVGRGYSQFIDEIQSVAKQANGYLLVHAKGRGIPVATGRWKLLVDPASEYLVREATFYPTGSSRPEFRLSNIGNLTSADARIAPASSTWQDWFFGPEVKLETHFDSISATADHAMLDEIKERIHGPLVGMTTIFDRRQFGGHGLLRKKGQTYHAPQSTQPSSRAIK